MTGRSGAGRIDPLAVYAHGPGAPVRATAAVMATLGSARGVVLVEGVSDQVAVETLAQRLGVDLDAHGVAVLPIGGAHATARFLAVLGPQGRRLAISGLCDAGEEAAVRRALAASGLGDPVDRRALERLGFFVCDADLEDELIRAVGRARIEAVLAEEGDLRALRTLQQQPEWAGRPFASQMHRFVGAGSRRKTRYAARLVEVLAADEAPRPLRQVLGHALAGARRRSPA